MPAARIPVLGIVGGIGSGKSTIAQQLCEKFRGVRLDADRAGHLALADPRVQTQLREVFGDGIFDSHGQVVRAELARRVFGPDEVHRDARRRLEEIVHPRIRQQLLHELEEHQRIGEHRLVVLDAALMLEAGWDELCDGVVFLDVPRAERLARVQQRGWTESELARREASQLDIEEKRRRADFIAKNSETPDVTVEVIGGWLRERFPSLTGRVEG